MRQKDPEFKKIDTNRPSFGSRHKRTFHPPRLKQTSEGAAEPNIKTKQGAARAKTTRIFSKQGVRGQYAPDSKVC